VVGSIHSKLVDKIGKNSLRVGTTTLKYLSNLLIR